VLIWDELIRKKKVELHFHRERMIIGRGASSMIASAVENRRFGCAETYKLPNPLRRIRQRISLSVALRHRTSPNPLRRIRPQQRAAHINTTEPLALAWFKDQQVKKQIAEMLSGMGLDEYTVEGEAIGGFSLPFEQVDRMLVSLKARALPPRALARSRKLNSTRRRSTYGVAWSSIPQSAAPLVRVVWVLQIIPCPSQPVPRKSHYRIRLNAVLNRFCAPMRPCSSLNQYCPICSRK
jgi:hypothetical protein